MKILRIVRLILVIIASILLIGAGWFYYSGNFSLRNTKIIYVNIPIEFSSGKIYSGKFKIEKYAEYYASLKFNKSMHIVTIDSLLGKNDHAFYKEYKVQQLPFTFSLWQNDSIIYNLDSIYRYNFYNSIETFERGFAEFWSEKDISYHFVLKMKKSVPELQKTHPELNISITPAYFKQLEVNAEIENILSGLTFIAALIIIAAAFFINLVIKYLHNKQNQLVN